MPEFTENDRYDPYKNFRFVIKFAGQTEIVAGVTKVGGLKVTTEVVKHRVGGDNNTSRKSPGQSDYDAITLERGVTHDTEFEDWANKVWHQTTTGVSLSDFRRNLIIEMRNEVGQPVVRYNVYRCWVSEYQPIPELDASGNAVAIQMIKIENEGWARDRKLKEPKEPSLTIE
ncbi:MAG: phage tail protein [Planctomycetota bacterium]